MAVFTPVHAADLQPWLDQFALGTLQGLEGISSGIENTNYFVDTDRGRYVLTVFEKLTAQELPFYLGLMDHLAQRGIPCPSPARTTTGALFLPLQGKPASVVSRLPGRSVLEPGVAHCAAIGAMTARLHLAAADYPPTHDNPRGPHWWTVTAPQVLPFLPADEQAMLADELLEQQRHRSDPLPRGVVHADLFRDNVLFEEGAGPDGGPSVGGVFDFYFAGADAWLFDLAVVVNDWGIDPQAVHHPERCQALLDAYQAVRPLTAAEKAAWPVLLRAAALRFWLSRLYDLHLPRAGELITPHDPARFRDVLRLHRAGHLTWNL